MKSFETNSPLIFRLEKRLNEQENGILFDVVNDLILEEIVRDQMF